MHQSKKYLNTLVYFRYRQEIKSHCLGNEPVLSYGDPRKPYNPPRYLPPKTKKYLKGREEAKKKYEEELNFCQHIMEATKLPNVAAKEKIIQVRLPPKLPKEKKILYSFDLSPYGL